MLEEPFIPAKRSFPGRGESSSWSLSLMSPPAAVTGYGGALCKSPEHRRQGGHSKAPTKVPPRRGSSGCRGCSRLEHRVENRSCTPNPQPWWCPGAELGEAGLACPATSPAAHLPGVTALPGQAHTRS